MLFANVQPELASDAFRKRTPEYQCSVNYHGNETCLTPIHLLEPEKTDFAQTNLKLTWVATETGFMQQATGRWSRFPGLPVYFIFLFVLCLHLLLVSFFGHGRLKNWNEKGKQDLRICNSSFIYRTQNTVDSQTLDKYKAMRKTSTIYTSLNQSMKQVT